MLTPGVGISVDSPTSGWSAGGHYLVDVVTAASPDIVSTASPRWTEVRQAGTLRGQYKPGTTGVAANAAASTTPDYLALSGGLRLLQELDEKNWSLTAGYGFGRDTVGRTGTTFTAYSHSFVTHTATASVSRILNRSAILTLTLDALFEIGDQSKPYRYIPMFAPGVAGTVEAGASPSRVAALRIQAKPLEQLPLDRQRWAVTGRIAWRGDTGTLRAEERLYRDSWALTASTTDVRYMQDVGARVIAWPHLRFHAQRAVSFWERAYTATSALDLPVLRTGDRELGTLYTMGGGAGLRWALGQAGTPEDWVLTATGDAYYTAYPDTLYVKTRIAGLVVTTLEATF